MSKIIIHNETNRSIFHVLSHIANVMSEGRISDNGRAFCYITVFHDGIRVVAKRNKNSDTFYVDEEQLR